jgi:hypothetical protein
MDEKKTNKQVGWSTTSPDYTFPNYQIKDRYGDVINDGDRVLISLMKSCNNKYGQELYTYQRKFRTFKPHRRSVMVGNYEMLLCDMHVAQARNREIRRLDD